MKSRANTIESANSFWLNFASLRNFFIFCPYIYLHFNIFLKKTRKKFDLKSKFNVKNKIAVVINNLLLFVALSLVSFVLYRFIQNAFFQDLFFVMAMVFGFIAIGFLIALLILFIVKAVKKR